VCDKAFIACLGFVMVFVPKTHAKTNMILIIVTQGRTLGYNDVAPLGLCASTPNNLIRASTSSATIKVPELVGGPIIYKSFS